MKTSTLNDFGEKRTVEQCQKISINEFIRRASQRLKEVLVQSEIEMLGTQITLTTSRTYRNGARYWFSCPICSKRTETLFITEKVGCRACLNLKYKKSRFKGMIENV